MMKYLVMAAAMFSVMGNTGCPRASDFMRLYGYTEIRPPSVLLSPGTMILIRHKDPFEAAIICDAYDSVGDVELSQSKTASGVLKSMEGKSSTLDASVLGAIKQNSRYKHVQTINVTLSNVAIMEITDANILEAISNRSRSCTYAVQQRVKQGYTVTMVSSALVADVKYTVNWTQEAEESLSQADKLGLMHELSVQISGSAQQVSDAAIYANGLIWGIRDDEYLSALSQPNLAIENFERNTRQIAPDKITVLPSIEPLP